MESSSVVDWCLVVSSSEVLVRSSLLVAVVVSGGPVAVVKRVPDYCLRMLSSNEQIGLDIKNSFCCLQILDNSKTGKVNF